MIANDERHGLDVVASGENIAVEGWLIYGKALNEGRKLFHHDDDKTLANGVHCANLTQ